MKNHFVSLNRSLHVHDLHLKKRLGSIKCTLLTSLHNRTYTPRDHIALPFLPFVQHILETSLSAASAVCVATADTEGRHDEHGYYWQHEDGYVLGWTTRRLLAPGILNNSEKKGKVLRKHSIHEENSNISLIEAVHQ